MLVVSSVSAFNGVYAGRKQVLPQVRQQLPPWGKPALAVRFCAGKPGLIPKVAGGMTLLAAAIGGGAALITSGTDQTAPSGQDASQAPLQQDKTSHPSTQPAYVVREENLRKVKILAQKKLEGLQASKDRKAVRLDPDRKAKITAHMEAIYRQLEALKDAEAKDADSQETTMHLNKLRHLIIANPNERTEPQRWSPKTVRIASCGQEELAGFYKTVVPLGLSLKKDEIRNLYQAIADVHRIDNKKPMFQPWPHEETNALFTMLGNLFGKMVGSQTQLASTNLEALGNVWSKDDNAAMKGKRKVLIMYNDEPAFRPELIGFIKTLQKTYDLSLGDFNPEHIDQVVNETESAEMGDFIIICPKLDLGKRRIEQGFDKLADFARKVPDAQLMVYVGAHGSYKDGVTHKGQEDVAILEGARVGVSHFKDLDLDEYFWMEQSRKLDHVKNTVPWFFDTCHSAAMLSQAKPKQPDPLAMPAWNALVAAARNQSRVAAATIRQSTPVVNVVPSRRDPLVAASPDIMSV